MERRKGPRCIGILQPLTSYLHWQTGLENAEVCTSFFRLFTVLSLVPRAFSGSNLKKGRSPGNEVAQWSTSFPGLFLTRIRFRRSQKRAGDMNLAFSYFELFMIPLDIAQNQTAVIRRFTPFEEVFVVLFHRRKKRTKGRQLLSSLLFKSYRRKNTV